MCVCVRACVRVCARVCVRARACVCVLLNLRSAIVEGQLQNPINHKEVLYRTSHDDIALVSMRYVHCLIVVIKTYLLSRLHA